MLYVLTAELLAPDTSARPLVVRCLSHYSGSAVQKLVETARLHVEDSDRSTFTVTNHAVSLFEGILNTVSVSPEYFLVRYKAPKLVLFNKPTFFKPNSQYLKLF